eukprot:TRINITY_DN2198_c0_g4_i1.p1 TRINITY_DN2198_c0_g4~~TRINITY_DN2198_c0_g4_i1.p1  ORF type:complete len:443 (+),score=170.49 TRINITY_DN2198_c0_g4_i1:97-1425(+)
MAPKKKATKMSLGEFQQSAVENWADDVPEEPEPSHEHDRHQKKNPFGGNNDWRGENSGGGGGGRAPTSSSEMRSRQEKEIVWPDKAPFTAFVGNFSFDLTEEELMAFFGPEALTARIIKRDREGKSKGYGYVEFKSLKGLRAAVDKDGDLYKGRNMRVDVTDPKSGPQGGFNAQALDWRDARGSQIGTAQPEPQRAPARNNKGPARGPPADFSRDAFGGSAQSSNTGGGGGGFREKGNFREQRQERAAPDFNRDALGSELKSREAKPSRFERKEEPKPTPGFSRDAMGAAVEDKKKEREDKEKKDRDEKRRVFSSAQAPTRDVFGGATEEKKKPVEKKKVEKEEEEVGGKWNDEADVPVVAEAEKQEKSDAKPEKEDAEESKKEAPKPKKKPQPNKDGWITTEPEKKKTERFVAHGKPAGEKKEPKKKEPINAYALLNKKKK